jgi:glyceraldehyde-3-phosphate dehydrogenase (NADP+)
MAFLVSIFYAINILCSSEMFESKLIIGNAFLDSDYGYKAEVKTPWDNSVLGYIQGASVRQAETALLKSHEAFATWKYTDLSYRVGLLRKTIAILRNKTDQLSDLLSKEIGKFPEDAKSEIVRAIDYMELCADAVNFMNGKIYYGDYFNKFPRNRKTGFFSRVPLGVVLAIGPFNYPINLTITKVAPALVTGNTVLLKSPTQGSLTCFEFYRSFVEAGFPPNVLNLVAGDAKEFGDFLLSHKKVDLIAFTGSTTVGNRIRELAFGIPLLMELGGKDAAIVSDKADLNIAIEEIKSGAFSYCGQRCTAQKIAFVYEQVAPDFKNRMLEAVKEVKVNPMINNSAADYIQELISDAKTKSVEVVLEGSREGNFVNPSILYNVNENMRIFFEEQFGPLLPIVVVKDENEAVSRVNSLQYGLQASVYTQDIEEAFRIADKLEVGTVQINAKPDRGPDNFPFGGTKDSGMYMQGIIETMELMTRGKMTVLNLHKYR